MKTKLSIRPENRLVVYENKNRTKEKGVKKLRVIHFNDVYNIEESQQEPVGGGARFTTLIKSLCSEAPTLIVFSGDAFSPSKLSLMAKGEQMVDVLNELNIHAACIGNHEFDMGLDVLDNLLMKSKFPWMLSNVLDARTSKPLLNLKTTLTVDIGKVKVGLFALAEKDWVYSLPCIDHDDIIYESFVHISRKISKELREKEKVDIVIALTHMRWKNDVKLANKVHGVDLVLGGHDHEYLVREVNDKWVIKSGTDFKELSVLNVSIGKTVVVNKIEKIIVDSSIAEDAKVLSLTEQYMNKIGESLERTLGIVNVALEGRTEIIRIQETNLGNFFCDIILCGTVAECALLNSGCFRSDRIHAEGEFKLKDLQDILSFDNQLCIVCVTGKQLHQVLENGVAKYGEGGGRFPQVSAITFAFNPSKQPLKRIDYKSIKVAGEDLDLDRTYALVTNNFMKSVDETLKKCPLMTHDDVPMLHCLIENYFNSINKIKQNDNSHNYLSSVIPNYVMLGMLKDINETLTLFGKIGMMLSQAKAKETKKKRLKFHTIALLVCKAIRNQKMTFFKSERNLIRNTDIFKEKVNRYLHKYLELAPKCEGRSLLIENTPSCQTPLGVSAIEIIENKAISSVEEQPPGNVNLLNVEITERKSSAGQKTPDKQLTNVEC